MPDDIRPLTWNGIPIGFEVEVMGNPCFSRRRNNTINCYICNNEIEDDFQVVSDNYKLCNKCYKEHVVNCFKCGVVVFKSWTILNRLDNKYYCHGCFYKLFKVCESCGIAIPKIMVLYKTYIDGDAIYKRPFCKKCFNRPRIEEYNYKPVPIFYKLPNENEKILYYGVELEIETTRDFNFKNFAKKLPNFIYMKSDGSLNCGFELVSHPFSWQYMKKYFGEFPMLFKLCKKIAAQSYKTNTCGMHVHMSKNMFTTFSLYKFMKFFYTNYKFIYKISQRTSHADFAQWAGTDNDDDASITYKALTKKGSFEKHVAVNLNEKDTVEIRIFKGTLCEAVFLKNMEFCKALFEFVQTVSVDETTVDRFVQYVKMNRKRFSNLYKFLFYNKDVKNSIFYVGD